MNEVLIKCQHCPEMLTRQNNRQGATCFNCKNKRKRKAHEKHRQKTKDEQNTIKNKS